MRIFSSFGSPRSTTTTNGPMAVFGKPVVAPTVREVSDARAGAVRVVGTAFPLKDFLMFVLIYGEQFDGQDAFEHLFLVVPLVGLEFDLVDESDVGQGTLLVGEGSPRLFESFQELPLGYEVVGDAGAVALRGKSHVGPNDRDDDLVLANSPDHGPARPSAEDRPLGRVRIGITRKAPATVLPAEMK